MTRRLYELATEEGADLVDTPIGFAARDIIRSVDATVELFGEPLKRVAYGIGDYCARAPAQEVASWFATPDAKWKTLRTAIIITAAQLALM